MLKGMFLSVERRRQDWREAKNVYMFGACEKRGQSGADSRKDWGSWQDSVAKIAGQSRAADRKDWWRRQDRAEQTAGKAGTDGKEAGRRWEERRGKNGKDNRQEAGGGGRKKLMSMKIIG